MKTTRIAVIGAGNMGGALIAGLIKNASDSKHIWAVDSNAEKLNQLEKTYQLNTASTAEQVISQVDVLVLAVKPQSFKQVLNEIKASVQQHKPLIIFVAAGVRVNAIQHALGDNTPFPIIRAMPNIAALIGCGATALFANQIATHAAREIAESILRAVGSVVWVDDESMMDTVTALSGSGIAYFFLIMQLLVEAAEKLGLPKEVAHILTIETALGAAKMAVESDLPLKELVRRVASPGGSTERALSVFAENNQLYHLLLKALTAAKLRAEELGSG